MNEYFAVVAVKRNKFWSCELYAGEIVWSGTFKSDKSHLIYYEACKKAASEIGYAYHELMPVSISKL